MPHRYGRFWEVLYKSRLVLVSGRGAIKERLPVALTELFLRSPIPGAPAATQKRLDTLRERVTRVQDKELGSFRATVATLEEHEAVKIADEISEIAEEACRLHYAEVGADE